MGMSEATAKIMTEPPARFPPKFLYIDPVAYERYEKGHRVETKEFARDYVPWKLPAR